MNSQSSILNNIEHEGVENGLHKSQLIQEACAKVGFDWPNSLPVFDKVLEEVAEIKEAIENPDKSQLHVQDELGDLLFACVNLCRHLCVSPELAIEQANRKFVQRFKLVELMLQEDHLTFEKTNLQALENYWQKAKKALPEI